MTDSTLLFTRTDALGAGYTDRQLNRFPKVLRGIYTTPNTAMTHELRCRAAAMTLPRDSVITGRSAATLLGVPLAGPRDDVEALVPERKYMNRRRGIRSWARECSDDEHVEWGSVRRATAARAAFDVLALNALVIGVASCDAMLHAGIVNHEGLADFVADRHYYGWRRAARSLGMTDGRAESFQESVLRVRLVQVGLHPVPQVNVYDADGLIGRVDLAFEDQKVAVEYDGHWHNTPDQRRHDEIRRTRLRDAGWKVIVITQHQLRDPATEVIPQVRAALGV